ncbi:MAG: CDP-diacylglycerol--serine O-phosphatidyltransferase [Oscillospiraceae bacterium]|nr:CDP-diacylglycerol--serine O-phosphatidyltransferase [Oscillospiraceae bacterium]
MRIEKHIKQTPNILTIANMLSGLTAIIILINSSLPNKEFIVTGLIVFSAALDFFDGYFARKLNAVTVFGKQLDSFSDIISFGVLPICLLNYVVAYELSAPTIIASFFFIIAGAFRLARFNTNDFSKHFVGLPIPVAGVALTLLCVAYVILDIQIHQNIFIIVSALFMLILSVLMVSKIRIRRISPKLK